MTAPTRRTLLTMLSAASIIALTSCGAQSAENASTGASPETLHGSWSFTDSFYEKKTTLDQLPESIVVDSYSAAALWDYGVRPTGVFGYGLTEEGGLSVGNADVSQMTIVGKDAEFNLEKLLSLDPEVIIGYGNSEGTGWTWWDEKVQGEATATAPYLPIKSGGRPVQSVIEDYAALAEALGGDTNTESAVQDKTAFTERLETLKGIAAEKPGLRIIALNGYDELYVGQKTIGQLALLEDLGFEIAGPTADSGWASLSWEKVSDYPADVVLSYSGTAAQVKDHPVFSSLPAVQSGQVVEWDDKRPYTYASYVQWFDQLIDILEDAKTFGS
ncbi:ABC transporter substrate-binding protein [Glutamicibacter sp. AOP38-B1-38]|uniref:ABC transporter substrate-binding protein n=1 Tax=unclassified Glutamicibacter TaxID=2627139 RepID=UPI003FB6C286